MRLVITCNGPGETAGWLRPLLRQIYEQQPDTEAYVFYVPDDYATGEEPNVVRELFPRARVYDPKAYLRAAIGGALEGGPDGAEAVLYLGGDLMHAARLHARFGGAFATYKFSRPNYAQRTARAYAVDAANEKQLEQWRVPHDRIERVGNLAIDGAFVEAQAPPEDGAPHDGILFMPGSRTHEVRHLVPFFFTAALWIRRENPAIPIAFGISPFTKLDDVRSAIEAGGDPRFYSRRGALYERDGRAYLMTADGSAGFPIVRNALSAARVARLAVTIPGTKVIELAALGRPVVSCTPANAPELAAINGPLTYLDRIPFFGVPAKRAAVLAYSRKYRFHTQPNIDAQRFIVRELHGTLTPGRVARVALECFADAPWLRDSSQALSELYREHEGAAGRMARSVLSLDRHGRT